MDKIIKEDALQIASSNYVDWRKLRGKTVLIAGANGYVPQFFVHGLLKRNEIRGDGIKVIAYAETDRRQKSGLEHTLKEKIFNCCSRMYARQLTLTENRILSFMRQARLESK